MEFKHSNGVRFGHSIARRCMFIVVKGSEIRLRTNPILRSLSSGTPQTPVLLSSGANVGRVNDGGYARWGANLRSKDS